MRRALANVAVAAASLSAALVLCNALAALLPWRVLHPPIADYAWLAYDPRLGMTNVPGFTGRDPRIGQSRARGWLRIDRLGFRGSDPRAHPGLRIACLGDSSTFGIWLEHGHAGFPDADFRLASNYPARLEHRLRARGIDAEVLNGGVLGAHIGHGLRILRERVLALRPDVVVLRFGFNEHAFAGAATHVQDPHQPLFAEIFRLLEPWALTELAMARVTRTVTLPAVTVERFSDGVREAIRLARANGADVVLLDYPLRPLAAGMQETSPLPFLGGAPDLITLHAQHAAYQRALRAVGGETGVPLVETEAALERAGQPTFSAADCVHPNARGAAVIARVLTAAITRRLPRR